MGFLSKLVSSGLQATVGTAINVVADTVTMGGLLTDQRESYTVSGIKKAKETIEESFDDLSDGEVF